MTTKLKTNRAKAMKAMTTLRFTKRCGLAGMILAGSLISTHGATRYVNVDNPRPAPPYANWASAAQTIQDAVDTAAAGDEIVVTNGVYQTGERVVDGAMPNRVAVTKPVTVRSVNGPEVTIIRGNQASQTTNGLGAVRCVYLGDGAALIGFTLTNGATLSTGDYEREQSGGGVWCASTSAVVSNCTLRGNSASRAGGGADRGTLYNCVLTGNSASFGGGVNAGTLNNCRLSGNSASLGGGGASGGILSNCALTGNSAGSFGGGALVSILSTCTLTGNSAQSGGGGAYGGTLNNCSISRNAGGGVVGVCDEGCDLFDLHNCTVVENSPYGVKGWGTLVNCIVYYNEVVNYMPKFPLRTISFSNSCTIPLPTRGGGNITNCPLFDSIRLLHLRPNSPCINAGDNAFVSGGFDLDGNQRIFSSTVDM